VKEILRIERELGWGGRYPDRHRSQGEIHQYKKDDLRVCFACWGGSRPKKKPETNNSNKNENAKVGRLMKCARDTKSILNYWDLNQH